MDIKTTKLLSIVGIINDCIKEAGSDGIPSGHLYSMLMEKMELDTYQSIIDLLVRSKKITNVGHLLKSL